MGDIMIKRYEELDSIRGLAALTVVFSHLSLSIANFFIISNFQNTPLHIFWAGHEAVIIFFLLSGFVLALPYTINKKPVYRSYIVKRICRIYLPYIVSILIGSVCFMLLSGREVKVTDWINNLWTTPINMKVILNHIFFLGDYQSSINFVTWSLIHEMRISIIFPLLMILVMKYNWKTNIFICMFLTVIYYVINEFLKTVGYIDFSHNSYQRTIHYVGIFMIGALLAKNRDQLINVWRNKKFMFKLVFLVIGIMSYTNTWWGIKRVPYIHLEVIQDWGIALGGSIFIISSLSSNKIRNFLLLKPVHFLGQISYSLYLLHGIVLLSTIHALYGLIPYSFLILLVLIGSIALASLSYYFVERPSIAIGRKLTSVKDKNNKNRKTKVA